LTEGVRSNQVHDFVILTNTSAAPQFPFELLHEAAGCERQVFRGSPFLQFRSGLAGEPARPMVDIKGAGGGGGLGRR
jgi:hypothetical protein